MAGEAVASFTIRTSGDDSYDTHGSIEICGNEQFILGRDPELCRYYWSDDLTISRQHLRVHCILYEQDPVSKIAPFVYATDVSVNGTYLKKKNAECAGSQGRGILMGCNNTFLLDHEDELQISETVRLVFSSAKLIVQEQFTPMQEREKAIFAQDYLITGRLLGEGGYGKVLIGIDQASQRQLACKIIKLDHLYNRPHAPNLRLPTGPHDKKASSGRKRWPTRVAACFREFDILKDLSHPNIVSIEKVFWSNNTIYLFQELVTGGDLFSFLEYKGGRLDNAQAVVVIRQVLIGVEYLHAHEIVHRDLKPDNILMTSLEDGARVVITDFGNARFLPKSAGMSNHQTTKYQRMFSYVGTLEFAAPEIHKANRSIPADDGYTKSVDIWSIGSITATVLTGEAIFSDHTHPQYYDNPRLVIIGLAAQCDLSVLDDEYHPLWSEVNSLSKNFIKRLLVLDEDDRMTATEALAHVWFANDCYAEDLEDLYMRSVEGWQPRPVSSQLIERISRSLPDLTAIGLPEQVRIPNTVSHFFRPSEQRITQNTMPTCSTSQRWRTNTPLPSITDDYANDKFQFASQISPSYEANDLGCINQYHDSVGSSDQQQQQFRTAQRAKERHGRYAYGSQETFNTMTQQGQTTYDMAAQNQYIATHDTEREDSHGSTESLNNVNNVAYSQHPYIPDNLQPSIKESMEVILVPNTPVAEIETDADLFMDESFQQTHFPEEYRRDIVSGNEHAYVLVYETPPDGKV